MIIKAFWWYAKRTGRISSVQHSSSSTWFYPIIDCKDLLYACQLIVRLSWNTCIAFMCFLAANVQQQLQTGKMKTKFTNRLSLFVEISNFKDNISSSSWFCWIQYLNWQFFYASRVEPHGQLSDLSGTINVHLSESSKFYALACYFLESKFPSNESEQGKFFLYQSKLMKGKFLNFLYHFYFL